MKTAKRALIVLATLLLCLTLMAVSAFADESYGNFWYAVSIDNEVIITDFESSYNGSVTIPATINGYKVTAIGKGAFKDCSGIKSVTISSNIVTIGAEAFENCASLTSVTIPNSVTSIGQYAFNNCDSLRTVTIGTGLETVPRFGFANCDSLTTVKLGNVTAIDTGAFYNCTSLSSITWSSSLKSIYNNGGWDGRDYGKGAFENCTTLTALTIPNTVTEIGGWSFYSCTGLRSIKIGSGVTTIGDGAFKNCSNATTITIGSKVSTIGAEAFENCSRVLSINIPNSVTAMGQYVFYNCDALLTVTIGTGLETVPRYGFAECGALDTVNLGNVLAIETGAFRNCISLTSVVWSDELQYIRFSDSWDARQWGAGAFENCSRLRSITLGDDLLEIGNYAFKNCSAASTITFGNSLTTIGVEAFENCSSVNSIILPDSLTGMGQYVFYNCDALTSVTFGTGPASAPRYGFANCNSLKSISLGGALSIENGAFADCYSLSTITWGDSLESILFGDHWDGRQWGKGAFDGCTSLTTIAIPSTVTEVGAWTFCGCTGVKSIKTGNGVTSIGNGAFKNCSAATTLTIGSGVLSIGAEAFENCDALTKVTIPDNVLEMGQYAFYDSDGLTTVVIGDGVLTVPRYGFAECDKLKSVDIGAATAIDTGAFFNCVSLTDVKTGVSLQETYHNDYWDGRQWGKGAFERCTALTEIMLPYSLITLGRGAFYECTSLTDVHFGKSLQTIDWAAFYGCSQLSTIHYAGTSSDWSYVTIKDDDNANSPIYGASFVYNSKPLTLTYSANSGTGAPSSVRAAYGDYVIISSTVPTLPGFKLKGWCLNKNGSGTLYQPGEIFFVSGNQTLYAVWERIAATPKISKAENAYNGVKLTWKAAAGAEKYQLFVKTASSGWKSIGYTSGTTFTWKNAASGTTYTFGIRCVTTDGKVYTSAFDSTGKTIKFIARPTIAKLENTAEGIKINWNKIPGAAKYRLVVKESGGSWKVIWNTVKDNYTWTGAQSGKTYTFGIRCTTADGKSYTSAFDSTGKTIKYVAQPSINKVANTVNGVAIAWDKVPGAAKYKIVVKTATSGWKTLGYSTGSTYTWTGAESGVTYTFGIRCVTSDGKTYTSSFDSVGKSIKHIAAPKIAKLEKTSTGIKITWNKAAGAEKYKLVVKEPGGSWKTIWNTVKTSYTWTGAVKGKTYIFSIRCINADNTKYTSSWNSTGWTIKYN